MKCLESIGLVDVLCIRIHHDKMTTNSANIKVSTPMIVLSLSPTFSSYTKTITKETPLLAGPKKVFVQPCEHDDKLSHNSF
jgi:hypothetical protein